METAKKTTRKSKGTGKDKILKAYRQALLQEGKLPPSVFAFCQSLGIPEDEFYEFFGSFDAIGKEIWHGYFQSVAGRLEADSNYPAFMIREKILAFHFTLLDVLRSDRSFVLLSLKDWKNPAVTPSWLKSFKADFDAWLTPVLNEGKSSGEIAIRPPIDKQYDNLLWLHLLFILRFWSKDDSAGFENTDAAVEKSVNLAFDLIGKGIVDNAIDFGKFLYQQAKS